jgi:exosome complex RNA-binding protein Csl4
MAAALREVTPLVATQRYGALYSVCSVCGAELTDDRSVELKLGPVCRGRFGF